VKRFTLADGDVFFQPPTLVGGIAQDYEGSEFGWSSPYFDIHFADGTKRIYRNRFKREVERERERLLSFDWT
jgi:hypothetical protein